MSQLDALSNAEKASLLDVLVGYLGLTPEGDMPREMTESTHAQIREAIAACIPYARHTPRRAVNPETPVASWEVAS